MKIIVTGGTGLIGSALKQICTGDNWIFLSSKDCNLLDYNQVDERFEKEKPDYIIHLAAEVGGLFKNMNQKVKMLENNVKKTYYKLLLHFIIKKFMNVFVIICKSC